MRIIAPMMILIMMTSTLAGCTGGDPDGEEIDDNPIVGDWYMAESLELEINQDGTVWSSPDENGSWSTEGDYLHLYFENGPHTFRFTIEGGWLWLTNSGVDGCIVFAPEMINEDEFEDRKPQILEEGNLEGLCG
ncbi:MAG: hypothetical protein HN983_03905 [Euryarchaeota archaeon]|jgi:hypothetical protein|nr:hypothetical protein [Euryarchaeota archaeon]MBT6802838.1 hypothetical protein [Euryarchaeota archaeon]MBT6934141.1 hypothetical protein [Euryarchaeota archaeon]MBT7980802.1 hypothetical protein [Euryarchaeota archaeon]